MIYKAGDFFQKDFVIVEKMINDFSIVTGDFNPIHINDEFAKKTVFKGKIAHGFLIGSLISSVIGNDFPGQGTIYLSQNLNFLKAVYINDVITVRIEVVDISVRNRLTLKTECFNNKNDIVVDGVATVINYRIKI